jgi:hypothetical protein
MKITNLDPKQYKRFFAFGCSFTHYKWLTWADIIGNDIEYYENWGMGGAGNHYIFNSVIEADARYNFNKDDLVIIFWSTKEREDRYLNNKWIHASPSMMEDVYGRDWIKKFGTDLRSFLIRDLSYMKAIQTIMAHKECNWANFAWYEFFNSSKLREKFQGKQPTKSGLLEWKRTSQNIFQGGAIADFFDDRDVIALYQDVFTNIDATYKWYNDGRLEKRNVPNNDLHPTPEEALGFLDWVWPENTLSDSARELANKWQQKIFEQHDWLDRKPPTRL